MFWDFLSLRPETTHRVMFLFSDRGTPDGYRHMNGYGSHTFTLVNAKNEPVYCKFHFKMKFDEVLREIGELGPFQRRVYFLATFPTILAAAETMSMLFIFNIPPHRCAIPNFPDDQFHVTNDIHLQSLNSTVPKEDDGTWSKCHVYSDVNSDVITTNHSDVIAGKRRIPDSPDLAECDRWVYDQSVFTSTVPTEFNTVCGRLMYRASSHMVVEIGCLLGTLICGVLADRFGRKIPFYVGGLALVGGGFGIAFSTSFITLNICRFILGIARMTLFINGLVLGMEMVGPSKRVLVGIAIEVMWCVGMVLLLVMGYFIRNWRYLEIALSVPSIVLLAYWWLIPESPRWLATKGRKEEALKVLEKIAASNGTTLPKVDDVTHLLEAEHSLSFLHVFKSRELVLRMLILFFNMFTILVNYYVLSYNISNLSGDIFVNFFLNIILELLGLTFPYLLLDRLGRKKVCCSSTFLGGAACMACVLPGLLGGPGKSTQSCGMDWIITVLASIGRFFVCIAFSSLYIYGAEIFPTVIRASTMGLGVTFARFGGLVAPYLADA
ncbi:hypothetical protein ACOMHN_020105 [Nucella lapillus]